MLISARRADLVAGLLAFAWDAWAQLGVSAAATTKSPWCHDPEALLLFSLEVARDDPRLFEEVLDWVVLNDALVSTRRLKTLCVDDADRRLAGAVTEYSTRARRPTRRPVGVPLDEADLEPLYSGGVQAIRELDPAFAAHGLAKARVGRSGKAGAPDLHLPVSFALRVRQILGLGARAEVVRLLITIGSSTSVSVIAEGAAYARRNVQEALAGLHLAGVVSIAHAGAEPRYAVDPAAWSALLGIERGELPTHRDWPQLLGAARRVLRWLRRPDLDAMSEYLRASSARDLVDEVRDDLTYAGVPVGPIGRGEDVWTVLDGVLDRIIAALAVAGPGAADRSRGTPEIARQLP